MADRISYDENLELQSFQSRGYADHFEFVDRDNTKRSRGFHSLSNFVALPRADLLIWCQDFLSWVTSTALTIQVFRLFADYFELSPLLRILVLLVLGGPLTSVLAVTSRRDLAGLFVALYRAFLVVVGVYLGAV